MGSNADRTAVLVRAIGASVRNDSSLIGELYTENVHGWTPIMSVTSAAELAVEFEDREDAFSDVEVECKLVDVGGEQSCIEWVARATHSGPLVMEGASMIERTGRRVTLRGVTIAEFDGDRICAFRQYWDACTLLRQLDAAPVE